MIIGIVMFGVLLLLIFSGVSISFSMLIATIIALFMGGYNLEVLPLTIVEGVKSYILLAIPFFITAGNLMNSAGITKRIFDFSNAVIGFIRGGLAHVNIFASMIFAGISGSSIADQGGLGAIEMRAMVEKGYDKSFSAALSAVSSILGALIPPSVALIIYSYLAEVSLSDMFVAGIVPGVLTALVLMIHVYITAKKGLITSPPEEPFDMKKIIVTFKKGFFALLAPLIILLGFIGGIFTPTEAGVIAIIYSIFCAFIYREFKLSLVTKALKSSILSISLIMFLTGVSTAMGWVVSIEQLPLLLSNSLLQITDNKYIILLLINIVLLILGSLMESVPVKLILLPVLLPIITSVGIDPIHFGIVITFNLLIGMITPPMGIGLYVMSSVGKVPVESIIKETLPLYVPLVIMLLILTFVPQISLWLPELLTGR
ncbi:TRAP transporter large permease [Gracilibacillus xinjiangensis]|uniref:TRAP transporter large permease n=1 Tax=Gracilibacillus xinjiangensis TaxID=1193282 RepID=A0ABV8WVA2_9BACI